jgi:hypothetical protein
MVCEGQVADIRDPHPDKGGAQALPLQPDLTAHFIRTILQREPWRSATPSQGVRIVGAHFHEPIDLAQAEIEHQLALTDTQFDAVVNLSGAQLSRGLSLDRSRLTQLTLDDAKVGGDVSMIDMRVMAGGIVEMDSVEVGHSLLMNGARLPMVVHLRGAKIGARMYLDDATIARVDVGVDAGVDMDSIVIAGHLTLRRSQIDWLWLASGKIGGSLVLDEAKLGERDAPNYSLDAKGLEVGSDLTMLTTIFVDANLRDARIHGDMNLAGAKQHDKERDNRASLVFDLTGATIDGALILGTQWYGPVQWRPGAHVSLRNTTVRDVEDGLNDCGVEPHRSDIVCSPGAWPDKLDLAAFDYQRLGSSDLSSRSDMASRPVEWWIDWLGREEFSPQPYEKLATVLRGHGVPDIADDILFAKMQRERAAAPLGRRIWLTLHWVLIGYGYHPFRALWWALGLVFVGVAVLRLSGEGKRTSMPYGLTYSVDMLLPIIRLREKNYEAELKGYARYYFYVHKIMGYVLASFLIAGLSGLTK